VWFLRYTSGQTDRQTDTLIAILRTPTRGEVIITRKKRKKKIERNYRMKILWSALLHRATIMTDGQTAASLNAVALVAGEHITSRGVDHSRCVELINSRRYAHAAAMLMVLPRTSSRDHVTAESAGTRIRQRFLARDQLCG